MIEQYKVAVVQAAPAFMDLKAGVEKTIALIELAAAQDARLIAFPECWIPGYPWWLWLNIPINNLKYIQQYHENSLVLDSESFRQISQAAKDNCIYVSLGASERDHGSLYISQFLISDEGDLIQARRKLKPTHVERTLFGEGDGSDLAVFDTALGKLGQLSCWEHMQPLTKYAMFSQHEQVHIGAWPSFSCYPQAYSLSGELNNALSQVYAAEGQCYVLAPCGIFSAEMVDLLVEEQHEGLISLGGGHAQIYGPDGRPLCDKLNDDQEGLLFAEIDLGTISIAKSFADPVGHYSRPDVTRLWFNSRPQSIVSEPIEANNSEGLVDESVERKDNTEENE